MVPVGERLKEERQRLELSQTAFAEIAGVTKKTQMLYESGDRSPDALYLAALAAAGVDVLYVLTGERGGVVLNPQEAALLDNYRHAPKDQQDILKATSAAFAQPKRRRSA